MLEKSVGGLNISLPFGMSLKTSDIMKTGLVGYGILSNLGALGKAFNWSGGFSLGKAWDATETTTRGATRIATTGVGSGLSQTVVFGNIDESDAVSLASPTTQESIAKQEETQDRELAALEDRIAPTVENIYTLLKLGIKVQSSTII